MPLKFVRNDITKMNVDAIVNAANTKLQMGGGVCGAIFEAAGARLLQVECNQIGGCEVGDAVITKGYQLPAKYVIHAVGPIWQGGGNNEEALLKSCYSSAMTLAVEHGLSSIAFPLISSGIYGYPKDEALRVAVTAISEFLMKHELEVYLVMFDKKAFVLSQKLVASIDQYIDDHYVDERMVSERHRGLEHYEVEELESANRPSARVSRDMSLDERLSRLDESFSAMLLRLIDEKGMTDVEAYKRANIDRRLFSKIRSNPDYNPSKATAIAFAIALGLNLRETRELLGKAGYTLSRSSRFDLIVAYFIELEVYDIFKINEVLFAYDQSLLGA
ncbi:macro domain-containing protein [Acidaminobacter hydrogenoformans]|uniref:O-acetyl-ADP-ribose deacetylase (Regulator of RNase III), contains Macro domain n=1 Tax=Acidaminobacter hydrogenoformans DSM 2784 TaxID=1120920 RepID=A0A1G5S6P5_9FIRM|nr:macro domain-containing protein [Acidaminobacter hydrogenoformans]SCZ81777.1 O-acetyl-ADP-ribose deacetylase (regulator of RNase III), contains Macro domain [Acidaminobacter hydrogenoformans DSM 2784]